MSKIFPLRHEAIAPRHSPSASTHSPAHGCALLQSMAYREANLQNANRPSMQLKRRKASSCRKQAWPRPAVRSRELLDHDTSTVFHTNLLSTTHTGGIGLKAPKVFLTSLQMVENLLRCLLQFVHLFLLRIKLPRHNLPAGICNATNLRL